MDLNSITLTDSPLVKAWALAAIPDTQLDWTTLAFWAHLIATAQDRAERMLPLVPLLFEYQGQPLRGLVGLMAALSVFCVALPLTPMFLIVTATSAQASYAIAGIAFIVLLAATVIHFVHFVRSGAVRDPVLDIPSEP